MFLIRKISLCVALTLCLLTPLARGQAVPTDTADEARIDKLLRQMTLEEKIDYIGGTGFSIRAVPRVRLPEFKMSDGPLGVRSNSRFPSTVYAGGIGLAATWNAKLADRVGEGIGRDARARGIHFMLGPGVNIYRSPRNGRTRERLTPRFRNTTSAITKPLSMWPGKASCF